MARCHRGRLDAALHSVADVVARLRQRANHGAGRLFLGRMAGASLPHHDHLPRSLSALARGWTNLRRCAQRLCDALTGAAFRYAGQLVPVLPPQGQRQSTSFPEQTTVLCGVIAVEQTMCVGDTHPCETMGA